MQVNSGIVLATKKSLNNWIPWSSILKALTPSNICPKYRIGPQNNQERDINQSTLSVDCTASVN